MVVVSRIFHFVFFPTRLCTSPLGWEMHVRNIWRPLFLRNQIFFPKCGAVRAKNNRRCYSVLPLPLQVVHLISLYWPSAIPYIGGSAKLVEKSTGAVSTFRSKDRK